MQLPTYLQMFPGWRRPLSSHRWRCVYTHWWPQRTSWYETRRGPPGVYIGGGSPWVSHPADWPAEVTTKYSFISITLFQRRISLKKKFNFSNIESFIIYDSLMVWVKNRLIDGLCVSEREKERECVHVLPFDTFGPGLWEIQWK